MFSIIQPLFLQKLSLYIHIPIIYLGFEFGPQRIRDLAVVRVSKLLNILYKVGELTPYPLQRSTLETNLSITGGLISESFSF